MNRALSIIGWCVLAPVIALFVMAIGPTIVVSTWFERNDQGVEPDTSIIVGRITVALACNALYLVAIWAAAIQFTDKLD